MKPEMHNLKNCKLNSWTVDLQVATIAISTSYYLPCTYLSQPPNHLLCNTTNRSEAAKAGAQARQGRVAAEVQAAPEEESEEAEMDEFWCVGFE